MASGRHEGRKVGSIMWGITVERKADTGSGRGPGKAEVTGGRWMRKSEASGLTRWIRADRSTWGRTRTTHERRREASASGLPLSQPIVLARRKRSRSTALYRINSDRRETSQGAMPTPYPNFGVDRYV